MDGKYIDYDDDADMVRDKILLQRLIDPKKVNLPDRRTFYARYERVSRKNLPANVTIKKASTVGPRCRCKWKQQGTAILSNKFKLGTNLFKLRYLIKGVEIGSRAANSAIGKKKNIEGEIKQTPAIYNWYKKIKNNKI